MILQNRQINRGMEIESKVRGEEKTEEDKKERMNCRTRTACSRGCGAY